MAGRRGMKMPPKVNTLRQNMWRSIRIMRNFSIPGLITTVPGLKYDNAQKFVRRLEKHRYVSKVGGYKGGRPGDCQMYVLCRDIGPVAPVLGIGRSERFLKPSGKETEKETNKEKEEGTADDHERPDATAA